VLHTLAIGLILNEADATTETFGAQAYFAEHPMRSASGPVRVSIAELPTDAEWVITGTVKGWWKQEAYAWKLETTLWHHGRPWKTYAVPCGGDRAPRAQSLDGCFQGLHAAWAPTGHHPPGRFGVAFDWLSSEVGR